MTAVEVLLLGGPSAGRRLTLDPEYLRHKVEVPYVMNPDAPSLLHEYGRTLYHLHPTTAEGLQRYGVQWVGLASVPFPGGPS